MSHRCVQCCSPTDNICEICGISYCSQKCEGYSHKIVCYKEKSERLRSIIEYIAPKHEFMCHWSLSYHFYDRGVKLSVSNDPNRSSFCAICDDHITYNNDYIYVNYILKDGTHLKNLRYTLCNTCLARNRRLCHLDLSCTSKCRCTRGWWTFLMCLQRQCIDVPKDIKKILCSLSKPH